MLRDLHSYPAFWLSISALAGAIGITMIRLKALLAERYNHTNSRLFRGLALKVHPIGILIQGFLFIIGAVISAIYAIYLSLSSVA